MRPNTRATSFQTPLVPTLSGETVPEPRLAALCQLRHLSTQGVVSLGGPPPPQHPSEPPQQLTWRIPLPRASFSWRIPLPRASFSFLRRAALSAAFRNASSAAFCFPQQFSRLCFLCLLQSCQLLFFSAQFLSCPSGLFFGSRTLGLLLCSSSGLRFRGLSRSLLSCETLCFRNPLSFRNPFGLFFDSGSLGLFFGSSTIRMASLASGFVWPPPLQRFV